MPAIVVDDQDPWFHAEGAHDSKLLTNRRPAGEREDESEAGSPGRGALATSMRPPWSETMPWTMARPRPVPPFLVVK